jgi:hypothetical protein
MTSDPKPRDLFLLQKSEGTVCDGHADGIHRFSVVDLLELEAGVLGILAKEPVGLLSGRPDATALERWASDARHEAHGGPRA